MSIWTNLYTGTSGINAHGDAIGVVGDNIANVSTTGFKASRAGFADVLGGHAPGGGRLGAGTRLDSVQTGFAQGSLQQTGGPLDMAIRGDGFFVVNGTRGGQTSQFYTRDGRFALDSEGFIVNPDGLRLQGFGIDGAGNVGTQLGDLQLGAGQTPPQATTTVDMSLNLDAGSTTPAAFDPANPEATSNYSTSTTVYDSLGGAHKVDMFFRQSSAGTWEWHAMVDGGELTGGTAGVRQEIASGQLQFTANGELDSESLTASSASFVGAAANQTIAFDFGDAITTDGGTGLTGTTQFAGPSSVSRIDQNGFGFGSLVDVSINDDGTIEGVFSNGQRRAVARVALASFASTDGLARAGDSLFSETVESGQALIDAPGTGDRGAISGGALEASNVDLSSELVTLIAYQRAFQANVRTVTTADEMLAEIAAIKR